MIPAIQAPPLNASYVSGLGFGYTGFRNRLRNASFAINQRAESGTVTLAAGAYGHDGVKGGASGCTYTFSTSGLDTTLTISAGSLILPIEAALIEGGTYVLQNAGTAQARVWQGTGSSGSGSYAAAPFTVSGLTAATQTNVEFSTGTVLRPQFEPGAIATPFERRPIFIEQTCCYRYFITSNSAQSTLFQGYFASGATSLARTFFPYPMRAAATVVLTGDAFAAFGFGAYTTASVNSTATSFTEARTSTSAQNSGYFSSNWTATAEI